jgi:hypothetical protein
VSVPAHRSTLDQADKLIQPLSRQDVVLEHLIGEADDPRLLVPCALVMAVRPQLPVVNTACVSIAGCVTDATDVATITELLFVPRHQSTIQTQPREAVTHAINLSA